MAYPTPPVLDPIQGTATPNLTAGGPYDDVLNKIEAYFAQLGAYVDAQIATVRGEIPSTTDFVTAEQLEEVKQSASDAASAAATAQQTAEAAQTAATNAKSAADTAQGYVDNMVNIKVNLPTKTNATSVDLASKTLFTRTGSAGSALQAIANLFGNLMLATPNDDTASLLGYLGDNTADLTTTPARRSSAALTSAYEAGGITKSSSDPVFTSADLATCKVSAEGVPYKKE